MSLYPVHTGSGRIPLGSILSSFFHRLDRFLIMIYCQNFLKIYAGLGTQIMASVKMTILLPKVNKRYVVNVIQLQSKSVNMNLEGLTNPSHLSRWTNSDGGEGEMLMVVSQKGCSYIVLLEPLQHGDQRSKQWPHCPQPEPNMQVPPPLLKKEYGIIPFLKNSTCSRLQS